MPCLVNASRASLKQSASWLNWPLCGVLVIRDHASIAAYTLLVVFFCTILRLVVVFVTVIMLRKTQGFHRFVKRNKKTKREVYFDAYCTSTDMMKAT